MIIPDKDKFAVECLPCRAVLKTGERDELKAIEKAQKFGWKTITINSTHDHVCPDCHGGTNEQAANAEARSTPEATRGTLRERHLADDAGTEAAQANQ